MLVAMFIIIFEEIRVYAHTYLYSKKYPDVTFNQNAHRSTAIHYGVTVLVKIVYHNQTSPASETVVIHYPKAVLPPEILYTCS